jgi:predicted glutamine amidotransferase
MCRLFGLHAGDRRVEAAFWLLDAPDSLEEQSRRNPDGCGVAGFDPSGRVELYKAPVEAWDDPTFDHAARRLRSSTFVAHVRHASSGARSYENTHPFAEGSVVFAHNGALAGLDEVDAQLGEYRRMVHGDTDSERMFALILKQAAAHDDDLTAGITVATRWLAEHVPVLSLNLIVATPTDLWALRYPDTDDLFLLDRAPGGTACQNQENVARRGGASDSRPDSQDHGPHKKATDRICPVVAVLLHDVLPFLTAARAAMGSDNHS